MPRVGTNPLAESSLPPIPSTVAVVITHLPNRKGYHEGRFEVVERCLSSLRETANLPLYIWDNGSEAPFRNWLAKTVKPDFLMLSPNIGKASARTAILRSFPPGTILCFSDDDILFLDGWLPAQLELLAGFPNVGQVSGCPIRTQARWGNQTTIEWARKNAELDIGRHIPDQWEVDFAASIGREYEQHAQDSAHDQDYLITYNGLEAYAMAHHMQFICLSDRLNSLEYWPHRAMRAEQTFDCAVDQLGWLRLTTTERYCLHLGNRLE